MDKFVDICSFLGAWLLVAGPIYQASLELREQDIAIERIHRARSKVRPPKKVSIWWWLLPPVRIILQQNRSNAYRREYFRVLEPEDVESLIKFMNKATGWLLVAGGASLIAIKETYAVVEELHSPHYLFWLGTPLMLYVCLMYTVIRMSRSKKIVAAYQAKQI